MAEWRMLQLGSAMPEPFATATNRAAQVLSDFVPTQVIPPCRGGLIHEAGRARARAALLVETLSAGAVAVLAGGSGFNGMSLGDPLLAEVLPFLPTDMRGTIVGAMAHAHVLSVLAARHPALRVLIGPPVAETIGMSRDRLSAKAAAQELVELSRNGPPFRQLTESRSRVAPRFRNVTEPHKAQTCVVRPEVLRTGKAVGLALAGNLAALSMLAGGPDWPDPSGAVLFLESAEARRRDIDRALRRLGLLGILERVGAVIAAVPVAEIETPLDQPLSVLFNDVMEGTSCPVVINAFVGSGAPMLALAPGRRVTVEARLGYVSLGWEPDR
jgi:hypothetical protein